MIIISHDREFIDNIATHCIAFEEDNTISINVGGYSDWLDRAKNTKTLSFKPKGVGGPKEKPAQEGSKQKLSYNEQKELAELPAKIEKLESQIHEIEALMYSFDFYNQPKEAIAKTTEQLDELKKALTQAYARWEALEP